MLSIDKRHASVITEGAGALEGLDVILIAYGWMPGGESARSPEEERKILDVNFLSVASLSAHAAAYFESKECGTLAVISSVAGDRAGRAIPHTVRPRVASQSTCRG